MVKFDVKLPKMIENDKNIIFIRFFQSLELSALALSHTSLQLNYKFCSFQIVIFGLKFVQ